MWWYDVLYSTMCIRNLNSRHVNEDNKYWTKKQRKMTCMVFQTSMVITYLKIMFPEPKKVKKYSVLTLTLYTSFKWIYSRSNSASFSKSISQGTGRRGSTSHMSGRNSWSSSRGHRRRQSFETTMQDTINGYKEFQRQSLQQLCPGAFDKDDYDEFKKAEQIFLALELPKFTKFYWACINSLKELVFLAKVFYWYSWR